MTHRGFLLAAPQSGSGKTTVTLAVMAALARRGMKVAPFKCGPDFIDPGYHSLITGIPSINLDAWICPPGFITETFRTHSSGRDISIIEGVMGLFDGIGASSSEGSSAHIACITGAPVVLVVNARGMAASAAAVVQGFAGFSPAVRVAGVIFNNVGSSNHAELLASAMKEHVPEVTVFGCIPRDDAVVIPSRHLGLVTAGDNPLPPEFICRLADMAEHCLNIDGMISLDYTFSLQEGSTSNVTGRCNEKKEPPVRIAVARDAAFCFCYEDNLRLLREAGADIVFFSPLNDPELPPETSGVYLPGGYPELHADALAANRSMILSLRRAVEQDMPVYAECGGFLYLTEGIDAADAGFAGIFPVRARMLKQRKSLGYRQVECMTYSVVLLPGESARGHEFHYSEIGVMPESVVRSFRLTRQGEEIGMEGYRSRNCLGSYIHLHFGSNPRIAHNFVAACANRTGMLQT